MDSNFQADIQVRLQWGPPEDSRNQQYMVNTEADQRWVGTFLENTGLENSILKQMQTLECDILTKWFDPLLSLKLLYGINCLQMIFLTALFKFKI